MSHLGTGAHYTIKCTRRKRKDKRTKPVGLLKVQQESTPERSVRGAHEKELGLPGALRNVFNAVQNQVLELDVTIAHAPKLVDNRRRLVRLNERIDDLGDFIRQLRPGDGPTGLPPVYSINMTVPSFILRPLNSKRYRSAVAPNEHAIVSTNQPFILLVHRILKRHPALIPNGKPDGGLWIEASLAASLDAVLPLGDQHASRREGKRQGPRRDLNAAELRRRTPRDREILKRRRVRFK